MLKRKYENTKEDPNSQSGSERSLSLKQRRVQGLLDNGKTTLFRSLKVARGFERQKLGRRQKSAKLEKAEAEIARLANEVVALKNLNLANTAEIYLYRSLLKIKSIASASDLPLNVQATVNAAKTPQSAASANVQARLFNSTPVKTTTVEITKKIRLALGLTEVPTEQQKRPRAKDHANEDYESVSKRTEAPTQTGEAADDSVGFSNESLSEQKFDGSKSGNESGDYEAYASRIAGSNDDSVDQDDQQRDYASAWSGSEDRFHDWNGFSVDDNGKLDPQLGKATRLKKITSAPSKSTTFLPTLSMGGYWSASEPESEEDVIDGDADVPTRKNRRGQRARQKIAEMKYKENANHLKNQSQNRDAGGLIQSRARGNEQRGKRGRGRGGTANRLGGDRAKGRSRGPMSSGANSDPVKPKMKPTTEVPLHPSWEAAKKAKEQKVSVAFQGKKMVFD